MLANIIKNAKKATASASASGGDPYYSAVSLLLPMNGANGSTTFTDSSSNALAVTASGSAAISTTQSKFGGASGSFTGSNSYLQLGNATAFNLSSSDFTVEAWIYPTTTSGDRVIVAKNEGSYTTGYEWWLGVMNNNTLQFTYVNASATFYSAQSTTTIAANTWTHVAAVRSGSTVTIYINGVSSGTATSQTIRSTTSSVTVARDLETSGGSGRFYTGYIDDLRISKGVARYTSNFTPPTQANPTYESSTPADPYYGYTSLLLHMDGSSGSTNFVDSGPNALAVTASGDAQISTAQSKYGGASGAFDGAGDYLSVASNPLFNFGTGDFTMELWAKLPNDNVDYSLVSGSANGNMDFRRESTGRLSLGRAGVVWDANSSVINIANQWTHLAASRSGSTLRLFCNGIQIYSGSNSVSYSVANLQMGRSTGVSAVDLNGYIDDLRITKGYARYTSNFTPPTSAHPNA